MLLPMENSGIDMLNAKGIILKKVSILKLFISVSANNISVFS